MSRRNFPDRGLAVLCTPGDPFATGPDSCLDAVVTDVLGQSESHQGAVVLQHTSKERVFVSRGRNRHVSMRCGTGSLGVRTRVQSSPDTVLFGDIGHHLAGLEEGVDSRDRAAGGQDELELAGAGFGVELLQVDTDGSKGIGDLFQKGHHASGIGGHARPGVVLDSRDVFLVTLGVGDELHEAYLDFEPAGYVDVVLILELGGHVVQRRPWASLQVCALFRTPVGHHCRTLGVNSDIPFETGHVGFHVELAGGGSLGGDGIIQQHPKDRQTDTDAALLANDLGELVDREDAHADSGSIVDPLHPDKLHIGVAAHKGIEGIHWRQTGSDSEGGVVTWLLLQGIQSVGVVEQNLCSGVLCLVDGVVSLAHVVHENLTG